MAHKSRLSPCAYNPLLRGWGIVLELAQTRLGRSRIGPRNPSRLTGVFCVVASRLRILCRGHTVELAQERDDVPDLFVAVRDTKGRHPGHLDPILHDPECPACGGIV